MVGRTVGLPFGRSSSACAPKPLIVGVAVVMIMVAAFAGKGAYDAATAKHFTVERAEAAVAPEDHAAEERSQAEDSIVVHVAGAVESPGVVSLPPTARVGDAVAAAGGFAEGAATDAINLARPVKDGEQVLVLMREDLEEPVDAAQPSASEASAYSKKVNINNATALELEALSGIGPALAARIVSDREQHGPFTEPHDITRVSGIGERTYERFADDIVVG